MADAKYAVTWDLDSLAPDPATPAFVDLYQEFEQQLRELAAQSDRMPSLSSAADVSSEWAGFLGAWEQVLARNTELNAHVSCHAAADARNACYQQWEARLAAARPMIEKVASSIEFALQEAEPETLSDFLASDPAISRVRFYLEDLKRLAGLRLPREQELLAADLAVDGLHAWGRLYDRVSGSLRISLMEKGEIVEKSPGQVQFDSPERAIRENNFFAAEKAWKSVGDVCAEALNHIAGSRLTRYRRLGLDDHLVAPLLYNRMERDTLRCMWSTINARKPALTRYFEAKARLLGLEKLAWYDLQAPVTVSSGAADKLTYDRACDLVIETFDGFSSDLGDFARMSLNERWIEVENRPGKRQGGFCTGFPLHRQSRIFMTFTETPDSMSTLAHELGHAYHSFVLRDEPLLLQDYPMNLAETASTFAEAVLGEQRLSASTSASEQLGILDNMLADSVAFLMNIHARFLFEDRFHQERLEGEVPAERLTELMVAAQQEAYLDALDPAGWNPTFWISKLHFYISELPFYNFPYTFGYLLSLGLYASAPDLGDEFPERYRKFLLATGAERTEDAVRKTLGFDLTRPDFWNRSLDVVEQRVDQFVELVAQIESQRHTA